MSAQQDAVFYAYENVGFQTMTASKDALAQAYENLGRVTPTTYIVTSTPAGWGVTPRKADTRTIYMPEIGIEYAYDYII